MLNARLEHAIEQRKTNSEFREHAQLGHTLDVVFRHQGRHYLSFSSNNYLGLANHPLVIKACEQALNNYGLGSGSAYLISGYSKAHSELEEQLAEFLGYPKVLVFSCGYMANLGVIGSLISKQDGIYADKLNHASLVDGCLMSKASMQRYPHCNHEILAKLLQSETTNNKFIITEGLFGMDGTTAPLQKIMSLAKQSQATVLLDDSHGIGILGPKGKGSIELAHLTSQNLPILIGSFGKAFGSYGAFVAADSLVIESIKQSARTYIYTTAIPPALAAATLMSLKLIEIESWRREKLNDLILYFKKCTEQLNLMPSCSHTAIQPIIIGNSEQALSVSQYLLEQGIFARAIRPPTVPHSSARIRITLTALHNRTHIDFLLEKLSHAIKPS